MKLLNLSVAVIILFCLLALISYIIINITRFEVVNSKIPDEFKGYKIILLTDLHNRKIDKRLIKIINSEKPDIILFGGDISNDNKYNNFISLISKLSSYEMYYINGNHELNFAREDLNKLYDDIKKYVTIIENDKVVIKKGSSHINLYGLEYALRYYSTGNLYELTKDDIIERIGELDSNEYNMLLTHNPLHYNVFSEYGADLTMCGHLHGGIVQIPFVGGLLSPDFTFFPKYSKGLNKINNMDLIISRGIGYGGQLTIRINNPGEVVVITLSNE